MKICEFIKKISLKNYKRFSLKKISGGTFLPEKKINSISIFKNFNCENEKISL